MENQETNEPRIVRLPRNGPRTGQSVEAWLKGKQRAEERELERLRWRQARKKGH
jgi:hypothetical protein